MVATQGPAPADSSRAAVGDPGRRLPAARVGPVGEFPHAVPRVPGGGSREAAGGPHGGKRPRARCQGLVFPRRPLRPGRGACWRPARVRRRPGGAGAMGRAPEPWRRARPSVERGAADPWRPRVARLPGGAPSCAFFIILIFPCDPCSMTLTGLGLLVTGSRAPCPRQVRSLRSGERRAPPAPGAVRCLRRTRRRPEDAGWLAVIPGHGPARSAS
jgi:hypothetical protein